MLVVDDDPAILAPICLVLERSGCQVLRCEDARRALALLDNDPLLDVALLDVMLPHVSGLELLQAAKARRAPVSAIMMTASSSVETAVTAVKLGAFDYLTKPFSSLEKVLLTVHRAAEHARLIRANRQLERELEGNRFEELIGQSDKMRQVFSLVEAVSATPATVLVRGESGTGKELVARAIHRRSDRANRPFQAVNCSALTESVLASELFGHVKGAFTGAHADRKGLFESADGGTLFLDEIGDASPAIQVSLLRAVQEGEVKPVGANAPVRVDVRVVAATNANLEEAIARKEFREDLYYRLNVLSIEIPPLRERPEDIMLLVAHFLKRHAERMKRPVWSLSEAAARAFTSHDWPGNVRELENAVARAVVMCMSDTIEPAHLPAAMGGAVAGSDIAAESLSHLPYGRAKGAAIVAFERSYLTTKMRQADGIISKAARDAGMDRSNFKRLLREYGVHVGKGGDLTS